MSQVASVSESQTVGWRILLEINKSLISYNLMEAFKRAVIQKAPSPKFYSVHLIFDGKIIITEDEASLSWMPESIEVGRAYSCQRNLLSFAFLDTSGKLDKKLLKEYIKFVEQSSYRIGDLYSLQRFDMSEVYKLFQRLEQGSMDFATNCFISSLREHPVEELKMKL